jgi:hypothetical protein
MTGRGRGGSRGGRGGERSGRGRERGQNYTSARMAAKSGLCAALGNYQCVRLQTQGSRGSDENLMGKARPAISWAQIMGRTLAMSYRTRSQ